MIQTAPRGCPLIARPFCLRPPPAGRGQSLGTVWSNGGEAKCMAY